MTYRIKPDVLLEAITREYFHAHELVPLQMGLPSSEEHIIRGGARTIAPAFEDMLAQFLYRNLHYKYPKLSILVNQPITMSGHRCPRYPDLAICIRKDDGMLEIRHIVEAKMNMGWIRTREQKEDCVRRCLELVTLLKNNHPLRWKPLPDKKISQELYCFKGLKADIVIAEGRNDNAGELRHFVDEVNLRKDDMVGVRVLSYDELNSMYTQIAQKSETWCNRDGFDSLMSR